MRRAVLLLLALAWGWLVLGVYHKLGYEHATGYPPLAESMAWAIGATLPLLLGVFIADSRQGFPKYLRWLCAFWLAAQAAFLLIVSWLKPFGLLPLLGCLLLFRPEIKGPEPANPPPKSVSWRKRLGYALLGTAGATLFVWWGWFHNPLPSDEAMIQHFNQHRAEFEQLVQGYRNYRHPKRPGLHFYMQSEEVKALMKKLGVYHVAEAQGESGQWYPDTYSKKTIQTLRYLSQRPVGKQATKEEWLAVLKRDMPALFEGATPLTDAFETRAVAAIHLQLGTENKPNVRQSFRYAAIHNGYYHFPQPPRIKNGHILRLNFSLNDEDSLSLGQRVFDSLNDYPPNWERGECVLKRIDANWFITMCRSY